MVERNEQGTGDAVVFGIRWDGHGGQARALVAREGGRAGRRLGVVGGFAARVPAGALSDPSRSSAIRVAVPDTEPSVRVLAAEEPLALEVLAALDDFGTGYSSLAMLRELPVDVLKIPKPFVDGRGSAGHDRALLAMLVQLGTLFGLRVVAEGIERDDQHALLCELGCELGQGYLLGRPMPIEALAGEAATFAPSPALDAVGV